MRRHSTETLMGMTKRELVEYVRIAEHNQDVAEETLNQQAENVKDWVPVVHGHWYKAPHHPYRCSNCGEMALLDMYGESHFRSNYCPNCGAKMDGDGNG